MCIACELVFQIAMDELPDVPPPGFPRRPSPDDADFTCDVPPAAAQPAPAATPAEDERKS